MHMRLRAISLATVLGIALAVPGANDARANLIQNGDFETGNFSSWTKTGNTAMAGVPFFGEGSTVQDGHYFAVFNAGNATPNGTLSQIFTTLAGTTYSLVYDYGANGGQIQSITTTVTDAGNADVLGTQFATLPSPSGSLAQFSLTFTAESSSSVLTFTDYSGNPTNSTDGFIDNVYVPEPASLTILAIGVAGLAARTRRKTR